MLEVRGLCAAAGESFRLEDISLRLAPRTLTALVGKNGCGKSTLVSCIAQTRPYTGSVTLNGEDLRRLTPRERAKRLSLLPQTLARPHITVEELVRLGRNPYVDIGRRLTAADRKAVQRAMETVGVAELADRFVDELSGGERQRAYLAMTLAQETELLILDEPTTHLDMAGGDDFLRRLRELRLRQGRTLLVVMHDLAQAVRYADAVAVMESGRLTFCGSTEDCLRSGALERALEVRRYCAEGRSFFAAREQET